MAGGSNEDPTITLIFVLVLLGAFAYVIWYIFRIPILEAVQYIRLAEMSVLQIFDDQADACFTWLREAKAGYALPTNKAMSAALGCFGSDFIGKLPAREAMEYYTVTPKSLGYVGRLVGFYLRWLLVGLCGYFIYYALYVCERDKFRTRYTLESFIKVQAKVWPVIAPIVTFNPAKHSSRILGQQVPRKMPLFAEAMAPEEWLAFHRVPVTKGVPMREAVHGAFLLQLGPRWTQGFGDLPIYMQALIAAFALKGVQKREESDKMLGKIALCWSDKHGFHLTPQLQAEVKAVLKDPAIGGKAMEVANHYAYRTTALLGILKWARFMGGVLASAQFLWLRGVDRELWYAMNNLGRRSFHTEGAGAIAHFMAEDLAKRPLVVPRLETAILTINKYLSDTQAQIPPFEGDEAGRPAARGA